MALLNHANDSSASTSCSYSYSTAEQCLAADDVLAVVDFGGPCRDRGKPGLFSSGLTPLQQPDTVEVWYSNQAVQRGVEGPCSWSANQEQLFAGIYIDEADYPSQRAAIRDGYNRLLRFARGRGYGHMLRIWNYMADITRGEGEQERYKQFCLGRLDAFSENRYDLTNYPSACALGHSGGDSVIYLLAARRAGRHFENPQQISAYQYPLQYGPASPSFARATLAECSGGRQLYVSGTASIIGHESRHSDAMGKQLQAACRNIDTLLQHVGSEIGSPRPLHMGILKVYLRHREHLNSARAEINRHFGSDVQAMYVQAGICRRELLVEIDGVCKID